MITTGRRRARRPIVTTNETETTMTTTMPADFVMPTRYTLLIEPCETLHPYDQSVKVDGVRGIVFETDPDTGYKSVVDIVETTREGGEHMLDAVAGNYDDCKLDGAQVQATNMGRVWKRRSMIRKIIEQLEYPR